MEKKIKSSKIYDGRILKVFNDTVELDNGRITSREIVKHSGSVAMLPIRNNNVILVKQYRYAVKDYLLEIPAGTLEKDEDPKKCALRELQEEICMKASQITEMIKLYSSPGFINEIMYIYLCTNLLASIGKRDEDENIEIVEMDLKTFEEMIRSNKIMDGKTITAFLIWKSMFA